MQEHADLAAGWSCIDDLLEVLAHARAMPMAVDDYAPLEARTRALLGLVWDRMLLDADLASRHYRSAMSVALQLRPRPEGEVWFRQLKKRMAEMQVKARRHGARPRRPRCASRAVVDERLSSTLVRRRQPDGARKHRALALCRSRSKRRRSSTSCWRACGPSSPS